MFCNLSAFLLPNLENSTKRLIVVLSLVLVVSSVQAWEIIRKSGSFRLVLRAITVCSCGLFQVLLVAECLHFTLFGIILPTIYIYMDPRGVKIFLNAREPLDFYEYIDRF